MTYIFLWRLSRSDLRHSLTSKWTLKPHIYISLRNISTFLLKINTFLTKKKNAYIFFNGNWDPYHPYYDLYISSRIFKKWFETFPLPEIDFGTSYTFLRKISIPLRKISTFFPRETQTLITLIMIYIFLWGLLRSDLRRSPSSKWTLEPHIHSLEK